MKVRACGNLFWRRLARGEKKTIGDDGRQGCSTEYDRKKPSIEKASMTRSGRALVRGCFGVRNDSRDVRLCTSRALAVRLEAHHPLLSTDTVQMVNC